jgi:hypothetical protein
MDKLEQKVTQFTQTIIEKYSLGVKKASIPQNVLEENLEHFEDFMSLVANKIREKGFQFNWKIPVISGEKMACEYTISK